MQLIGRTIDDRFKVIYLLGEGGMASVYQGLDLSSSEEVAIKVVSFFGDRQAKLLSRFRREFDVCKRLNHPNIIKLRHFGSLNSSHSYIVMDLIEGDDLEFLLAQQGPLPEDDVIELTRKMAAALAALHAEGIVHRDLKPANIMILGKNNPIIMDFGLARAVDMTALTETGAILGTPKYMSPEQTIGNEVNEGSDIYQLGLIVFNMLTGKHVFTAFSLGEVLQKIRSLPPPRVSNFRSGLKPQWDRILKKCLEKDEDLRFGSANELLEELVLLEENATEELTAIPLRIEELPSPDSPTSHHFLPLLFLPLVILLIYMWQQLSIEYSYKDFKTLSNLNQITLSWQSDNSYPTCVQLLSPLKRTYRKKESTQEHHIVIEGLRHGIKYKYRLIYPDGTHSKIREATTSSFSFKLLAGKFIGQDLVLSWQTAPKPQEHVVKVKTKKGSLPPGRLVQSVLGERTELRIINATPTIKDIDIRALYIGGVSKDISLAPIVRSLATEIGDSVKGFDHLTVCLDVNDTLAFILVKDERVKEIKKRCKGYLADNTKALQSWPKAISLSGLLLGTNILSLSQRIRYNKCLEPFCIAHSVIAYEAAEHEPFPLAQRGQFDFQAIPMKGQAQEILLADLPSGKHYTMGMVAPLSEPAKLSWSKEFKLPNLDDFDRAELALTFTRFDNGIIRVIVNGKLNLCLIGDRNVIPRSNPFQRVPIEVLREGKNRLTLRFEQVTKEHINDRVVLQKCLLRLLRPMD